VATELLIWRQRAGSDHKALDPATESRIRPQISRFGDRELDPATELPIRRQRVESRHRASDPVTESRISLYPETAHGFPAGPVLGFFGRISLSHGRSSLSRGRISLSLLPDHSLSPSLSKAHQWSGCVWPPAIDLTKSRISLCPKTARGFPAELVRGFSGRISLSHGRSSLSRGRISLSLLPNHSLSPSLSRAHWWSGCVWSPDIELGGGSVTNEYNGVKRDFAASFFLCFKTTTFVLMKGWMNSSPSSNYSICAVL
jgi:hypothetical protein